MTTTYYRGQQITATATFTVSGVATNPDTVTFHALDPLGVLTAYVYGTDSEVTRTATGVYRLTLTLDDDGPWKFDAIGTGACQATVLTSIVARPLVGD